MYYRRTVRVPGPLVPSYAVNRGAREVGTAVIRQAVAAGNAGHFPLGGSGASKDLQGLWCLLWTITPAGPRVVPAGAPVFGTN